MTDYLSDVLTALNQSRFEMANDFASMREGNMKFYRQHAQAWVNSVAQEYGDDDWRFYGTAIVAGVGDTLLDVVGSVGEATFIDPLRLGAGVQSGEGVGWLEDGLRVVGVVGGALKIFRIAKIARLSGVSGGLMSCTPTSVAKAARLASVEFTTMEELAQGTGSGLKFGASGPVRGAWIEQVLPKIQQFIKVEMKTVSGSADVEALVAQRKGPVVFSVEWKGPSGIPGGGHTMMGYLNEGGVFRLADQFGSAHTWRQGANGLEIIAGPGSVSSGPWAVKPGTVIGVVNKFYSPSGNGVAYILHETVLMKAAGTRGLDPAILGQLLGVPLLRPLDKQFNLKLGFAAAQLPGAPSRLRAAGRDITHMINLSDLPITDAQKIVGWWYVWVGAYFWTYVFDDKGNVRWTDPYNHKTGTGKWEAKNGVSIKWGGSTTVDTWDSPINVNGQTGSQKGKAVSALKAVKIGSRTSGVPQNIIGRWKVRVSKWTWHYDFDANGRVKWTDPFNGKSGTGQWTITKDGLYTWWSPGSTTTEEWNGPLDGAVLTGQARMSGVKHALQAEKMTT